MSARKEAIEDWYESVPRSIRRPVFWGVGLSVAIFGGFGTWAATAPLAAAVVTHGSFVATGQNKLVQHLEGGIIKDILVSEGERVEKGQPLLVLDGTAARTNVRRLLLRIASYEARSARLQAMMSGARDADFSHVVADAEDAHEVDRIVAGQRSVFLAELGLLDGRVEVIEKNRESLQRRVEGSTAQKLAVERQRTLITEELGAKRKLFDQGLYRRSELFAVERAAAEAEGAFGKIQSEIGDLQSQIARLSGQVEQTRQEYRQGAAEELQSVQIEMDDMREQLLASRSVLGRTEVTAPVSGTLVRMNVHTAGGVIESGKQIAEILPSDEKLMIETWVDPKQINEVRLDEPAGVRLTSFNQRTTPQLSGTVAYVSADTVQDPRPGQFGDVYVVRVVLGADQLARVSDLRITPGMPADIFIETAHRTFLDYVTKPVRDSMSRAFLEH